MTNFQDIFGLCVRFGILMAASMKITDFWDVTQCGLDDRYQHFEETCCLQLLLWRWSQLLTWKCSYLSTGLHSIRSQQIVIQMKSDTITCFFKTITLNKSVTDSDK
jgi:hypothetical protein